MTEKTKLFFATAFRLYPDARFFVKAEDDAYVLLPRLLLAADQWEAMSADFIGCMGYGRPVPRPSDPKFEVNIGLFGSSYILRVYGPLYALSRRVVEHVIVRHVDHLRMSGPTEDVAVSLWMLGHAAKYFEDRRLCSPRCHAAAVGVWQRCRTTMGWPLDKFEVVHADPACRRQAQFPLPYFLPSEQREWMAQHFI